MGKLSDLALRRIHTGVAQRSFALTIGGVPYTEQVRSLHGDFDPKSGGSALSIDVQDSLEGLEDATVILEVGYGTSMVPYFIGKLQEPSALKDGQGVAYGPFKLMADQSFGEPVSYQGVTLRYIFKDLEKRAGYRDGVLEVLGGDYVVDRLEYTEETRLSEAAKAIAGPAKYVFYDISRGKRRVMPEPLPTATGSIKAMYAEHNYPLSGFKIKDDRSGHYAYVIVFRRDGSGNYEVRRKVPVLQRGRFVAPENRIYYVSEFPGDSAAAGINAFQIAHRLAYGELGFSLSDIWFNPELDLYDVISVEATERRPPRLTSNGRPGKWVVSYQCLIRDSLSFEIGPEKHHMSLSGGAVKIQERKVYDPIVLVSLVPSLAGVITSYPDSGLQPDIDLQPDVNLQPDDAHYLSDPGLQADVDLQPDVNLQPDDAHYP